MKSTEGVASPPTEEQWTAAEELQPEDDEECIVIHYPIESGTPFPHYLFTPVFWDEYGLRVLGEPILVDHSGHKLPIEE